MPIYRPSIWGGAGALFVFLLFLIIGLASGLFWWFWLWFLILLPIGGDWRYQQVYVVPTTSEIPAGKETTNLLEF
jgi:hypothetical protein